MTTKTRTIIPPDVSFLDAAVCHMTLDGEVGICGSDNANHAGEEVAEYAGGPACPLCGNPWCPQCLKIWDLWMEHRIWEGAGDPPYE